MYEGETGPTKGERHADRHIDIYKPCPEVWLGKTDLVASSVHIEWQTELNIELSARDAGQTIAGHEQCAFSLPPTRQIWGAQKG